jgi:transcriptional regulator with XRE-family HTH domain
VNTRNAFLTNLRNRRIALNLSQERVAELLGSQLRNYQRMESGERGNPTLETLNALGTALEIEPWELLKPGHVAEPERQRAERQASVVTKVSTKQRTVKKQH